MCGVAASAGSVPRYDVATVLVGLLAGVACPACGQVQLLAGAANCLAETDPICLLHGILSMLSAVRSAPTAAVQSRVKAGNVPVRSRGLCGMQACASAPAYDAQVKIYEGP